MRKSPEWHNEGSCRTEIPGQQRTRVDLRRKRDYTQGQDTPNLGRRRSVIGARRSAQLKVRRQRYPDDGIDPGIHQSKPFALSLESGMYLKILKVFIFTLA
jgi:hypothetical protein